MKKRTILLFVLISIIVIAGGFWGYSVYNNETYPYEVTAKIEVEKSKYHLSGSWWGYNQHKIASIGTTSFSSIFDNANLDLGNSSEANPYYCHFTMLIEDTFETFDSAPSNATCNVLADPSRSLVYYIVSEPKGEAATGGYGWTNGSQIVMYTYHYNNSTHAIELMDETIVIEEGNDGRQRLGTDINDDGQLMIAYGSYDAMHHVYTYDPILGEWASYHRLSNPDQDSLMYNYAIIKNLEEFYVLAIQDTARAGQVYYQYVKFFAYLEGTWTEQIVVDYRDTPEALTESILLEHTAFTMIDDEIHLIIRSDAFDTIRYFIYDGIDLIEQPFDYMNDEANWIRIIPTEDDILFVYNHGFSILKILSFNYLEIYSLNENKVVFQTTDFVESAYVYTNIMEDGTIQVLGYCGSDELYDTSDAYLFLIKKS